MKIGKNYFYYILVIISLVHAATYAWYWSEGSEIVIVGPRSQALYIRCHC